MAGITAEPASPRGEVAALVAVQSALAQRPGALRRQIPGASEAVILRQLTELVSDGILTRTESSGYPLHVTYGFTPYGEPLGPIVEQLCAWGRQHQDVKEN